MTGVFRKPARVGDDPLGEAAALRWLAAAEPAGGARIARVVSADAEALVLERVAEARASAAGARAFGAALARTHAAGAAWWGCPPPGWPGEPWMGRSRTPLVTDPDAAAPTWGGFYAACRIDPFARRLRDGGAIDADDAAVFDRLSVRLRDGEWDAAQPALVAAAGHAVARVHGDMWSGNVLYDGGATGAALIDPMAHGGHAETDLGTLSVFGFPFLADVYAGYDAASPFADGWRERIPLHELGIVIMHADLFGGGYTGAALDLARRYV
jgi:fructosamine-3-kinase